MPPGTCKPLLLRCPAAELPISLLCLLQEVLRLSPHLPGRLQRALPSHLPHTRLGVCAALLAFIVGGCWVGCSGSRSASLCLVLHRGLCGQPGRSRGCGSAEQSSSHCEEELPLLSFLCRLQGVGQALNQNSPLSQYPASHTARGHTFQRGLGE